MKGINIMIKQKILFELPVTADDFSSDVLLEHFKGKSIIKFSYMNNENVEKEYSIEITDVYKFIFTSDSCCSNLQIENSYERLISIEHSPLIHEVNSNLEINGIKTNAILSHFMIYIPDFGCCEYIAERINYTTT